MGKIVWFLDARQNKNISRQISDFHTPAGLAELCGQQTQASLDWLINTPIERIARLRPYQQQATFAAERAIMDGRRNLLLAVATTSRP
jgi:type I restriction enzyme R subunit